MGGGGGGWREKAEGGDREMRYRVEEGHPLRGLKRRWKEEKVEGGDSGRRRSTPSVV